MEEKKTGHGMQMELPKGLDLEMGLDVKLPQRRVIREEAQRTADSLGS